MFVWRVKSFGSFYPNHHNQHPAHHTLSTMSSNTNIIAAKLAEHVNTRKQLELEAEQEHFEEERLAKELEEMRVEEEWKAEEKREAERQVEEQRKR